MLRRLVDQETAYFGTNAGSAGFFYLFAATEQGIHDQGAGHLFLIEEALHQPLCHVLMRCYAVSVSYYTAAMWLMHMLFAPTASTCCIYKCNNDMGQHLPSNMSNVTCTVLSQHIEVCSGSGLLSGSA